MTVKDTGILGRHHFKQITPANWRQPDMTRYFPGYTPSHWVKIHLIPRLGPNVPEDIAALFEVARGTMVYGWYFYPLITLAAEQCSRVLEAGVRACCKAHGVALKKQSKRGQMISTKYIENIRELIKLGIIPGSDEDFWKIEIKIRNQSSHPEHQVILAPASPEMKLQLTADILNVLFP